MLSLLLETRKKDVTKSAVYKPKSLKTSDLLNEYANKKYAIPDTKTNKASKYFCIDFVSICKGLFFPNLLLSPKLSRNRFDKRKAKANKEHQMKR